MLRTHCAGGLHEHAPHHPNFQIGCETNRVSLRHLSPQGGTVPICATVNARNRVSSNEVDLSR
jgi:hypothetical protein